MVSERHGNIFEFTNRLGSAQLLLLQFKLNGIMS